ncbi:PLP-dependent aminotransferase family protein [Vagococcus sp. DIV0080]|uniref:PLP-dependent aminotransferase family protein n=1 Tax=Candidatus Vagococcus giribetii TaxID=2230876 RepID=A0ABS3HQL2_9ENTE|nr:PLP-dependent aminotransferase family protein [Vagococcus sp. DIV0080]MBO0475473.1 PLP-dependent aminotransferase family protein [Vagococcus sp. DIV0080]
MEKYLQISQDILNSMREGEYKSGDKLPSINQLSKEYNCSRGTVIRAYLNLKEQQFVYVKNKSGYYSSFIPERSKKSTGYHLESGNPLMGTFHIPYAKQSLSLALEAYQMESLDADVVGVSNVVKQLTKTLSNMGIYTKEDSLFLTMGIQQTVYTLFKMKFPNNRKNILLEEPTYRFVVDIFLETPHENIYTIKRTKDGFDLLELEAIFKTKEIKFFYLTPRNHNPLGTTLSVNQRNKIVALAQEYDVYIAEDDYFLDANYIPNYTTLHYLASGKNCIFLGSFTKILPYLRIGFVIVPAELQEFYHAAVDKIMHTAYYTPPLISQSMLGILIQNNFLEKNKSMINSELKNKIKMIKKCIAHWDKTIVNYTGFDGYYSSIQFKDNFSIDQLIENLKKLNIFVVSNISNYFFKQHFDNSIRISIAKVTAKEISEAFPIIYEEIIKLNVD